MDPLSITGELSSISALEMLIIGIIIASIIAVLQITGTTISLCYDYRTRVKNAPKTLSNMTDQLVSLRSVLERLVKLAETEDASGSPRLSTSGLLIGPDGILEKCKAELTVLNARLQPSTGWKAVGNSLIWPLKEGEMKKALDDLEKMKATLQLALTADQTYI